MKAPRQLIVVLMLLGWLAAGAHVALEHGGQFHGPHTGEEAHHGHHHDEEPAGGEGGHHHDLGALRAAAVSKDLAKPILEPRWVPLYEQRLAELAALLQAINARREPSTEGESPPDERAAGWLHVVQTALPVRGPSLLA